ncbi:MAG: helix-turn-helix transcriptional regulator, partial [Firmicutes bacterium]|nr:helix-turn-helix transcriptional regulator [Candidatus Caballimonas caccae]
VYKWEKGLSEPDIETINKICSVFKISANEFFGTIDEKKPQEQTVIKAKKKTAKKKPVKKAKVQEEPEEKKVISAYCEKCNAPCSYGEYKVFSTTKRVRHGRTHTTVTEQHTYCNDCYEEYLEEQRRIDNERKKTEATNRYYDALKSLKRGIIWGSLALIFAVLIFIICKDTTAMTTGGYITLSIIGSLAFGTFIAQCFWDSYVIDILLFFSRSFKLPGVIFSLSLEGIVSLILIKITLSILSFILSAFLFIIGIIIASACSLFSFPFALTKQIKEYKSATENLII